MRTLTRTLSPFLIGGLLAIPLEAQAQDTALEEVQPAETAGTADDITQEETIVLMDARWADLACAAWNENPTLTDKLAAPGWVANNEGRGHKVIQLYRTDCEASPWVELQIADQEGKALCTYGGPVMTEELLSGVDYVMNAKTQRWEEMGAGNYGPMKGMMTGRLKFKGPKFEAMRNMGPFSSFLRIMGAVESDATACP